MLPFLHGSGAWHVGRALFFETMATDANAPTTENVNNEDIGTTDTGVANGPEGEQDEANLPTSPDSEVLQGSW